MLWIWDVSTGERRIARPATVIRNQPVQFSPDGSLVAIGNQEVQVFNSKTGAMVTGFSNPFGSCLRFSSDGASMFLPRLDNDERRQGRWSVTDGIENRDFDSKLTVVSRDGTRKAWLATDEQPNNAPVLHVADANGKELMTIKFQSEPKVPKLLVSSNPMSDDPVWMQFQDNGSILVGRFPMDCDAAKAMVTVAWNINTGETLLPRPDESIPNHRRKYDWHVMGEAWPRQGSGYALMNQIDNGMAGVTFLVQRRKPCGDCW